MVVSASAVEFVESSPYALIALTMALHTEQACTAEPIKESKDFRRK
jgi:hypothetical protein